MTNTKPMMPVPPDNHNWYVKLLPDNWVHVELLYRNMTHRVRAIEERRYRVQPEFEVVEAAHRILDRIKDAQRLTKELGIVVTFE